MTKVEEFEKDLKQESGFDFNEIVFRNDNVGLVNKVEDPKYKQQAVCCLRLT